MSFDLSDVRPATDLLIAQIRDTVGEIRAHEHPQCGEDFYCLNLVSWLGERMGPVLRRLADEQAETSKWRQKHTALAEEFAAEAEQLQRELAAADEQIASMRAALDGADASEEGRR
ncbi:hypothetical protein [Micromonospora sp. NPDC005652]|uniref:hypothetical protein n=1 Tax=Micromonospora sp. NPDC005652 TaxID=3157046 RepID=UPI0033E583A0